MGANLKTQDKVGRCKKQRPIEDYAYCTCRQRQIFIRYSHGRIDPGTRLAEIQWGIIPHFCFLGEPVSWHCVSSSGWMLRAELGLLTHNYFSRLPDTPYSLELSVLSMSRNQQDLATFFILAATASTENAINSGILIQEFSSLVQVFFKKKISRLVECIEIWYA